MVPEQKRAWFVLAVFAVALLVVVALIPLAGVHAWGGLGIFGLAGLTPLLFRKKRVPGEVAVDERDKMILEKATLGGGMTSYVTFVLGCMIPWFICMFQGRKVISIQVLPPIVICGAIVFVVVRAVVTLVLYGREADHGED